MFKGLNTGRSFFPKPNMTKFFAVKDIQHSVTLKELLEPLPFYIHLMV
jgi:hypothetical protein